MDAVATPTHPAWLERHQRAADKLRTAWAQKKWLRWLGLTLAAGYGLFILPNRRRKAREEFREKTDSLRERLGEVVRRQFESESNRSVERMREAIAPYTRFVTTETTRLQGVRDEVGAVARDARTLRGEIGG